MIQKFLIRVFGLNYQTTIAGIFVVIGLIPGAITMIANMYAGQIILPLWVVSVGVVCTFISIIYAGLKQRSIDVKTNQAGVSEMKVDGELKTEKQILEKPKE